MISSNSTIYNFTIFTKCNNKSVNQFNRLVDLFCLIKFTKLILSVSHCYRLNSISAIYNIYFFNAIKIDVFSTFRDILINSFICNFPIKIITFTILNNITNMPIRYWTNHCIFWVINNWLIHIFWYSNREIIFNHILF